MKLGIQFFPEPELANPNLWDATAAFARAADDSGLASFWLWDHFMKDPVPGRPDSQAMLDCFVALGGVATVTTRVLIGQLVAAVPYRNPALTAKMATTLDLMSHGRSVLGLGAGWNRREFDGYGWDFGAAPDRLGRLEEAVQIVRKLWGERPASFQGRFYRLDRAYNDPPTVQQPHPPLMVGGSGERVTLRIAAQYADWCNVGGEPDEVRRRFAVLRAHCQRLGRDPDTLVRSNFIWGVIGHTEDEVRGKLERLGAGARDFAGAFGTPDRVITRLREFAAAGSQHCIIQLTGETDPAAVRLLGERIAPALADA